MAKNKKPAKKPSVISIRALSDKAKIPHMKVYNNINGAYNSLTLSEKTDLANTFFDEVLPLLTKLGFYIEMKRIKDPNQS